MRAKALLLKATLALATCNQFWWSRPSSLNLVLTETMSVANLACGGLFNVKDDKLLRFASLCGRLCDSAPL